MRAVAGTPTDAVMIALADMPRVTAAHIYRMLDAADMFLLNGFFEILEKAIDRCREAGVVAYQIVLKNS